MAPPTALIYIAGHGAKVEKDGPVQTRSAVPPGLLDNVGHYSPVGNERVSVLSDKLMKKSILTNTSIIPSLFMYLLCKITVKLDDFLSYFIKGSTKLDEQAGIHYESAPIERFQKNAPVDDKPLWFMSMGEHLRGRSEEDVDKLRAIPGRIAAGDPIHFPLGVWCVLVHNADGKVPSSYILDSYSSDNINPSLFHQKMIDYTISNNCLGISRASKLLGFKNEKKLISLLTIKGIPITDFIDPFTSSKTPDTKTYFNDLNITNSKNIPIFQKIIDANIERATWRIAEATKRSTPVDPNDRRLYDNYQFIKDAQMHAALTKHSSLYDIIMICKALMPPGTIIQIIDTTCSSDYARQPPLSGVLTGYNPDEDSQRIYESLPRTPPASSASSASSQSSAAQSDGLSATPSWSEYFTEYVGGWFNLWFPRTRPRTPSPLPTGAGGGSRKSHKNPKNRNKSKRKVRSTKRKTQKIRRRRK